MTENELRLLVRDVIVRQLGREAAHAGTPGHAAFRAGDHAGFARFVLPSGRDGECIIEPAVACNHCGFCKSYGH